MMADRAFLGCIGRVNVDHTNTSNGGFVVYELLELIETPRALSMSPSLGSNRCPFSDATEIFKSDQRKGVFGFHNKFLRDAMVSIPLKSGFMTGKSLKMSLCAIGAATLKAGFKSIKLGSGFIDLLTREYLTGRVHGYVLDTKIHANNIFRYGLFGFRNFDYDTQIELPVMEDQICLASDPVHSRSMVVTDLDRNLNPALESQQRDLIKSLPRHDPLVVYNGSIGIKGRFDRLVSLIGFTCFRNSSDGHLRGYTKLLSKILINKWLQLDFVGCMHFKSNISHIVTSSVKLMHSLMESVRLLWFNFNLNLKSLHHDSIDKYSLWYKYLTERGGSIPLNPLKGMSLLEQEAVKQQPPPLEDGGNHTSVMLARALRLTKKAPKFE